MVRELQVVGELVDPVAPALGLQLDEEETLGPDHGVVRPSSALALVPGRQLELVNDDGRVVGCRVETQTVEWPQEDRAAVRRRPRSVPA
jgi:hypothetical protein